ncbi:MAG: lactate utilization protein B [Sulfolobaceae archaeon]
MEFWEVAIERAISNHLPRVKVVLDNFPYVIEMARKLREAKLEVIKNIDYYIDRTISAVKFFGGNAYFARTPEEAREIVGKIVGKGKLIVMGKSMVAYEVGLRRYLTELGNEVWETDLGEFLIQLTNEPPSHIIAPAVHMPKERAEKVIREKLGGVREGADAKELVARVREFLREKFLKADVGITGANAVAADTGSVVLVENEGNIRMSTIVPPIHIAITGVDKIVPTLEYALMEVLIQSAYNGLFPPTYISVTSGPSSTGDIEMTRVSPAHGPKEFHLILLDNGRVDASKDPILSEALLCIRCGRCHFHCPVYRILDGSWGVPPYSGPMGAMWSYIVYKDSRPSLYCTHSGGCKEVCPMRINIPKVIEYIKSIWWRKNS